MTQRYILISTSNQHLSLPWSYQQKLYTCISCFSSACYMFHPSEPPWFNRHSSITCTVETIKLIFFYGFPYFLITSSPLGPNISLITLCYSSVWKTKVHTHMKQQVKLFSNFTQRHKCSILTTNRSWKYSSFGVIY